MTVNRVPTIVVVDDDDSVRSALDNLLRSVGLAVATFGSAEDFLASSACHEAACLVADVQMPGMSGLDLQRRLAGASEKAPPVILITAFPQEHARRQAEAEGAFGYLAKPFDGGHLLECIDRALKAR